MKKDKLKLNDLKVQSFVTNLQEAEAMKAIGGQASLICLPTHNQGICYTQAASCPECPPMYYQ